MERRCEEPHCLQLVPEHLLQAHQDQHLAERLFAEEFEQQKNAQVGDAAMATAIAQNEVAASDSMDGDIEDSDYQFALALNRELREEEEQRFFRQVQVYPCPFCIKLRNVNSALKVKRKKNIAAKA